MAAVAALFLVGVLTGALGMYVWESRTSDGPPRPGPGMHERGPRGGPGWGRGGRGFGERLMRDLDLSEEQRTAIDTIVAESRAEGERLRREFGPVLREHMQQTRERIREVLTEEQRERFDALNREHRRRAERFLLGRPEPPPEPPAER
jgi:Spy/CpxP family protein refolding chaperone